MCYVCIQRLNDSIKFHRQIIGLHRETRLWKKWANDMRLREIEK